jgi:signal transduction histidine kinase
MLNSGPHIAAEQVTRLQRPFERLGPDRTDTDGGAGLGLSIVASIARAHGADLSVESRADGGLAVTVTFEQAKPDGTRGHVGTSATAVLPRCNGHVRSL